MTWYRPLAKEGQVATLEAENQGLSQQVQALEVQSTDTRAELDAQPVVIDANGVEVGEVVGVPGGASGAVVLMDVEGFPLFVLRQSPDGLLGTTGGASFQSNDCSGAAFIEPRNPMKSFPSVFHAKDTGRTYLTSDSEITPTQAGSHLNSNGICSERSSLVNVAPAIRVPEMEDLFTPPFEVVTRGDLIAE